MVDEVEFLDLVEVRVVELAETDAVATELALPAVAILLLEDSMLDEGRAVALLIT